MATPRIAKLSRADKVRLDKELVKARRALKRYGFPLTSDAGPEEVVAVVDHFAECLTTLKPEPSQAILRAVGFLFAEQLHRAHDGVWRARPMGKERPLLVYTHDGAIAVFPDVVVARKTIAEIAEHYTLAGIFKAFGKVVKKGAAFRTTLTPKEAKLLFRFPRDPASWSVWGVKWKLEPWA